ncbi:MAG TPA: TonB-dependent receptor [Rhodocyclaceae bacterium]|nr:TonB-dependent receptor [Rhodocyclaceae bacterium]
MKKTTPIRTTTRVVTFSSTTLALAMTAVFPVLAQTASSELPPVVVTSTRQETPINQQLSDVTVLDREQIEQAGQSSLAELLGRQAAVEFTSNGGPGTNTSVFIRGAESKQTVVLVDGVRIGSATSASANFARLPLSQIERIEILRGPASSLYGADAIGGVIQIFTRKGSGAPRVNASAGYGTYGTYEVNAGVQGGTDMISYNVQAGHYKTNGFSSLRNPRASGYNPDNDGYSNDNASASFSIRPAAGHELGVNLLYSTGPNQYDPRPAAVDHVLDQDQISYSAYSRNKFTDRWTSTVRVGRAIDDSTALRNGIPNSIFRTSQNQFQWQNDVKLGFGTGLLAVEELNQKVDSTTVYRVDERTIRSYIIGWNGSIESHRFQLSGRSDDNSQFGRHNTGTAAYGYQFLPELRGRLAYGTAFRAPSFNDLYFPSSGNPNLKPEEARNREVGLIWEKAGQQLSATYYDNDVTNMIVTSGRPLQARNVNQAKLQGWTFAYGGTVASTRIDASLDLSEPKDATTGKQLIRRAEEQFKISASRDIFGWLSGIEFQAVGRRFDDAANLNAMGGYSLTNLFVEKNLGSGLTLFARANNIFDREYELARDYGTPGANIFVGLRYQEK